MTKIHAITFASSDMSYNRLIEECKNSGVFESVTGVSEKDLPSDFQETLKKRISEYGSRGYGYWSWKPFVIKKKLSEINNGDILIYMDAGNTFNYNEKSKEKFDEYISQLVDDKNGIIANKLNDECSNIKYSTNKLIQEVSSIIGYNFSSEELKQGQFCATEIFIRKCDESVKIIDTYNDIMQSHFELFTDKYNEGNSEMFVDNRHDQSLWSLLCVANGVNYVKNGKFWWPNFDNEECYEYPILETRYKKKIPNIIANNCVGGFLYNILNLKYGNPFIWTNILDYDFLRLEKNIYDINFKNRNLYFVKKWENDLPKNCLVTAVNIDKKINLYFTHFLYSTIFGDGLFFSEPDKRYFSNNIDITVAEQYDKRANRLIMHKNEPIFIYFDCDNSDLISDIVNTDSCGPKIIITNQLETKIGEDTEIYNYSEISNGNKIFNTRFVAEYLYENSSIIHNKCI